MPLNIYLTGFMGSGKSRVGRELAAALRRPHLDTDQLLAEKYGITPGDFIRERGEAAFRVAEQAVLKEVAEKQEFVVVSTGGGVPVYPGNRRIMKESGITATLEIPLEQIAARLSDAEKATRPLWDAERFRQRQPFYQDCEIHLDATQTPAEIVHSFRKKAADFLAGIPTRTQLFQRLLRQCAKDSAQFGLFEKGDRILVGLSGGEDSFLMMEVLQQLARRMPFPIELVGATIDLGYPGFDATPIRKYCDARKWEFHLRRLPELQEVLSRNSDGKPCPLCARLRRGQLHHLLRELHCNKLALGHHLDDLCVSFLMSLFHGAGLKTMGPNVPADGETAQLIRPLWGLRKADIHNAAEFFPFPKIQSCPFEGFLQEKGDRKYLETLLEELDRRFPGVRQAMKRSMGDVRLKHLLLTEKKPPVDQR